MIPKHIALFLALLTAFICEAQPLGGLSLTSNTETVYIQSLAGKERAQNDFGNIEGSPYLTNDFKKASVITRSGFKAVNVPVKFNIYNNEIIFRNGGLELAMDSVRFVWYLDNAQDSSTITVFASGYPAFDGKTNTSVYQLLGGGVKVHFIKYSYQKIEPKKTMGYHHLKEFVTYTEYYIYTPAGELKKIRLNSNSIAKALPEMQAKIGQIAAGKHLNLKKEEDVAVLFQELDKL